MSAATANESKEPTATFVGPDVEEISRGIDLTGKNALVTGANSGIGKETARVLLLRGAFVILTVRNKAEGEKAVEEFARTVTNAREHSLVLEMDLADDQSIRRCAAQVIALDKPIHLLILNAGIMAVPLVITPWCGFESHFAVNHLGHFLLTQLLLDKVIAAANARVVVVSSLAHMQGGVNFEDINFQRRPYHKWIAYAQSKTANILFAKELNRKMEEASLRVRAYALHPGAIKTNLGRHMLPEDADYFKGFKITYKTIPQGAATSVWAATSPDLEGKGGLFLEDAHISEVRTAEAKDMRAAYRLWRLSEQIVFEKSKDPVAEQKGVPAGPFNFFSTAEEVTDGLDLTGKLVLVTGANSGIGKEVSRVFLLRGADVILGCRSVAEGQKAVEEFAASIATARERARVLQLDLAEPRSILDFAGQVKALSKPIDILMLNAGVMALPERTIVPWCGKEAQFAINHLGHFLLFRELLPLVKASGNGRIVVLSSGAHRRGGVRFGDLNFEQGYDKWLAYGQSKTANILFAVELNRRLAQEGSQVRAYAVHPGVIRTNLARHIPQAEQNAMSGAFAYKTVHQGAATQVWAAVAPQLEGKGGYYLMDCKVTPAREYATDPNNCARLWQLSEEVLKAAGL